MPKGLLAASSRPPPPSPCTHLPQHPSSTPSMSFAIEPMLQARYQGFGGCIILGSNTSTPPPSMLSPLRPKKARPRGRVSNQEPLLLQRGRVQRRARPMTFQLGCTASSLTAIQVQCRVTRNTIPTDKSSCGDSLTSAPTWNWDIAPRCLQAFQERSGQATIAFVAGPTSTHQRVPGLQGWVRHGLSRSSYHQDPTNR